MSTEFQIIFTSIMTLLAGLALFVLKGVFKKFEEVESTIKDVQDKVSSHAERLAKVETKVDVCPHCNKRVGV